MTTKQKPKINIGGVSKFRKLILSVVVVGAIAIIVFAFANRYILSQAEQRVRDVLLEARALHSYVQYNMHPEMYNLKMAGRMPAEFYSPEILSSSYITRHVFEHFNDQRRELGLPLVSYRMAAINPRNIVNRADAYQAGLIDLFNSDSSLTKITRIVKEKDGRYLVYARPFLRTERRCLRCHGKKEEAPSDLQQIYQWSSGFDWREGDIAAIEVIKTPLVHDMRISTIVLLTIFVVTLTFIIVLYLNTQLKSDNTQKTKQNTELEEALAKLRQAQAQLIQSEKMASLGILTAGVAHEINNPLNYIMGAYVGFENYFEQNNIEQTPHIKTLLNSMKLGVDRAANIVKGLNQFSRDSKSHSEECNIHSILDNCINILKYRLKYHAEVVQYYNAGSPVIIGNVGEIHQVFINILTNAIQAIKENGTITIRTENTVKGVKITIIDNGVGIPAEYLDKISDPFFTTKEPGEGTGLGLSITYKIVDNHNGTIDFVSKPKSGTTVNVFFPFNNESNE